MKRARWGATHRIHEHFVDGFPELEERFVREREAAERRFEYNLGSRNFATKREGEEGIDTLKVLFRKLDRAIGLRDATMVQTIREEFLAELRHWNWRKGARVEFKRRKLVHHAKPTADDSAAAMALAEAKEKFQSDDSSSVDDLDLDDVNGIDDRVPRIKQYERPAPQHDKTEDKHGVNDARRHLLAESVAIALVTLKWRCLNPDNAPDAPADGAAAVDAEDQNDELSGAAVAPPPKKDPLAAQPEVAAAS